MKEELESAINLDSILAEEALTLPQIDSLLADDRGRLEKAVAALDAAQQAFARATERSRFATDEAHEASFAENLGPLSEAEQEAEAAARVAQANSYLVLTQLRASASLPTLDNGQLAVAGQRLPLIADEVAHLNWPQLRDRIRRAFLTEDRPGMLLYAQIVPDRIANGDEAGLDLPGQSRSREEVAGLLRTIRDRLRDRSFDTRIKETEGTLIQAADLDDRARKRRREAELYSFIPEGAVRIPADLA